MPLDIEEALREGNIRRATQRHKNVAKLDLIDVHEAGDPWPIKCDVMSFGELGPGVPLYFNFVRHVIKLLIACSALYCFIGVYYCTTTIVNIDDDGQRQPSGIQLGTSMDEWAKGLYVGCSMYGMRRLWNQSATEQYFLHESSVKKTFRWSTAASRGPWRGDNSSCLSSRRNRNNDPVWITVKAEGLDDDVSGKYFMYGWSTSFTMPWFAKVDESGNSYVLHLQEDVTDTGYFMWKLARLKKGHLMPSHDEAKGEPQYVDVSLLESPPVAQARQLGRVFPTFANWTYVSVDIDDSANEDYRPWPPCNTPPGVARLRCYDVAVPCSGCQTGLMHSLTGQKFSKDSDILIVSCACSLILVMSIPCLRENDRVQLDDSKKRTVSDDDYAVYITNLPSSRLPCLDEVELAAFLREALDKRYPDDDAPGWRRSAHHIVRVTFTFRLGRIFSLLNRVTVAEEQLKRLNEIIKDVADEILNIEKGKLENGRSRYRICEFRLCCRRLRLRRMDRRVAHTEVERAKRILEIGRAYESLDVAGAIVTFEHAAASRRALHVFGSREWSLRNLLHRQDVALYRGQLLRMERPPEPTDIMWQNLGERRYNVVLCRCLGYLIELTCMVLLTAVTFIVRQYGVDTRKKGDASEQSWLESTFLLLTSVAVVGADVAMRELLLRLVVLQKHQSWTRTAASSMWKLTVAAIINGALVVLGVHVCLDDLSIACELNWYLPGNLADDILSISIVSAFSTPFIQLLPVWNLPSLVKQQIFLRCPLCISRMLVDPITSRMTQEQLTALFSGAEYRIAYRYATIMKTLFLSLCYAPIIPLVVPIGIAGLSLQFWADKICLIRMARRPPWQSLDMHRHARTLLPLAMMPIPLLTVFLLRGTHVFYLVEWLWPCINPYTLIIWHKEGRRWATAFVLSVAILVPFSVAFLVAFGRGGVKIAKCIIYPLLLFVRLCLFLLRLIFHTVGRCLPHVCPCLPGFYDEDEDLESSDDEEDSLSYYSAQHFLPATYHLTNPVYRILPSVLNPETVLQPEPIKKSVKLESEVPWFKLQMRRDEQRRKVEHFFSSGRSSLRDDSGRRAALCVGTCGKSALALQFAFEKLLGFSFNAATEQQRVSIPAGFDIFCTALREHQDEESTKRKGKVTRSATMSFEMAKWRINASDGPVANPKARWAMVRRVFLKDRFRQVAFKLTQTMKSEKSEWTDSFRVGKKDTEIELSDRSLSDRSSRGRPDTSPSPLTRARRTAFENVGFFMPPAFTVAQERKNGDARRDLTKW